MTPHQPEVDAALIDEARQIWDANATFWDEQIGDGNQFHRELIAPAVERLLDLQPGQRILEVGCGNGVSARRLAQLGARVTAVDGSPTFIARARSHTTPYDESLDYRVVDATDEAQLLALGAGAYDAIVSNMVLMDLPVIAPLVRAARRLLTTAGRFVFSIQHPAFNSNAIRLCGELNGEAIFYVKVSDYLTVPAGRSIGIDGQPVQHWYFHRPLHELFGEFFQAGFVIDGLEEPAFLTQPKDPHNLTWSNIPGIPPVLVVRAVPRA
jgi:2-polyprenyl-3-methyl-5-hydroxy-6-metoxy-1,4-benzoquinol methylase